MKQKLDIFRTFSKRFIFIWCLAVLFLAAILNFPALLQKGPALLNAQDNDPEIISEDPVERSYNPEVIEETPIQRIYDPQIVNEIPVVEAQQAEIAPPSAPTVVRPPYSECAGGPGMVQDVEALSDGTYRTFNQHYQAGVCGDVPSPAPIQSSTTVTINRSYSECAGGPGRVRDVDALSDGTYHTYNEHFQSGACGDPTSTPMVPSVAAIQQIQPATTEEYQCESGNKVYYRVYINVVKAPEKTGRVDYNSPTCGSGVPNQPQGGAIISNNSARTTYPTMSASCVASPSQSQVGETVTWQVLTNGGSGSFKYRWSGDESVQGKDDQIVRATYSSAGVRTVQAEIIDRTTDQKTTVSCSTTVSAVQTLTSMPTQAPIIINNYNQGGALATPTPYPTSTPAPVIQTQVVNAPIAQCPSGTTEKSRSSTQLICERPSPAVTTVTATNVAQCPTGTIEKSRSGGVLQCEQQPTQATTVILAAATPQPVQTIVTSATAQTAVQCPPDTTEKSRSATQLICERQLALAKTSVQTVQSNAKSEVKVLGSETSSIRELPRTGLPLAAVGVSALAPFGWRLRKLFGVKGVEESAQDIWLKKQLDS